MVVCRLPPIYRRRCIPPAYSCCPPRCSRGWLAPQVVLYVQYSRPTGIRHNCAWRRLGSPAVRPGRRGRAFLDRCPSPRPTRRSWSDATACCDLTNVWEPKKQKKNINYCLYVYIYIKIIYL